MGGLITTKYFVPMGARSFGMRVKFPAMGINIEVPAWKAKAANWQRLAPLTNSPFRN